MSNNLIITGKRNSAHISSSDDGEIYASIFGTGEYILNRNQKLGVGISGNVVTVNKGEMLIQGRYARVGSPESITIEAPADGTARLTDVCMSYDARRTYADEPEGIFLTAVHGHATSTPGATPSAPILEKGDIFNHGVRREVRLCSVLYDRRDGLNNIELITGEGINEFTYLLSPYQTIEVVAEEIEDFDERIESVEAEMTSIKPDVISSKESIVVLKDGRINIDTTSSAGQIDSELYTAIVQHGWQEVIE